ncbi:MULTISPECIES: excisionase [Halomonadaceae]|mgnify:FL=1|jgi:hypothetical protein|uniref:Excisionase n=1 Tax=Vreelandella halophila TaxID=86177 RepID=A0A9X5B6J4_9GAMM|nr:MULTISPECIES: excisionase [Halomonas]MYL27554.1 excisionase [Halomonas utahensis]MYL74680.1 excisionase [Halomonas sp. 22501_18_FS]
MAEQSAVSTNLPKWIKAKLYAQISGITTEAQKKKRQRGEWLEGVHWITAPDGGIMVDWRAIDAWVEGNNAVR